MVEERWPEPEKLDPRTFALIESTVEDICKVRARKTGHTSRKVMDRIDWKRLADAAIAGGLNANFVKVMRGEIALAEMQVSGVLPS